MNRAGEVPSYELVYGVSFDGQGPDGKERLPRQEIELVRGSCERATPDRVLLVVVPRLDRKDLRAKWVQELDRVGVQVWPLEGQRLVGWLEERLRGVGFHPDPEVAALLAARVEGNLLAAVQEVEKLRLLRDPRPLDEVALLAAICDNARLNLFDLTDTALNGDRARMARVIAGLAGEGTAPPLVLRVLARELRMLVGPAFARDQGQDPARILAEQRVPESRQAGIRRALKRLDGPPCRGLLRRRADADRAIKGLPPTTPGLVPHRIADGLAGGFGVGWEKP